MYPSENKDENDSVVIIGVESSFAVPLAVRQACSPAAPNAEAIVPGAIWIAITYCGGGLPVRELALLA